MQNQNREAALDRALFTLREVVQKLTHGVNKVEFDKEYFGKCVSPGTSVRRFVEELRLSGSLEETSLTMKFRQKSVVTTPSEQRVLQVVSSKGETCREANLEEADSFGDLLRKQISTEKQRG